MLTYCLCHLPYAQRNRTQNVPVIFCTTLIYSKSLVSSFLTTWLRMNILKMLLSTYLSRHVNAHILMHAHHQLYTERKPVWNAESFYCCISEVETMNSGIPVHYTSIVAFNDRGTGIHWSGKDILLLFFILHFTMARSWTWHLKKKKKKKPSKVIVIHADTHQRGNPLQYWYFIIVLV